MGTDDQARHANNSLRNWNVTALAGRGVEGFVFLLKRLLVVFPSVLSLLLAIAMLGLSQVSDLMARRFEIMQYLVLLAGLTAAWLIPMHLGARILLDERHRRSNLSNAGETEEMPGGVDVWLPRALVFVAIAALALAIHSQLSDYTGLAAHLHAGIALDTIKTPLYLLPAACLVLFIAYLAAREGKKRGVLDYRGGRLTWGFSAFLAMLVVMAGAFPSWMAETLGGLLFFPMLAGSWIMPVVGLIMLTRKSLVWRRSVQFGTLFFVVALVGASWLTDNRFHDIRVLPPELVTSATPAQETLSAFIDNWKEKNHCAEQEARRLRCQAIFITAEGGASRAAFQVATVLGALLDEWPTTDFRNKLFLFSGVSGGSLGLATARQALADSPDGAPPCVNHEGDIGRNWIYYGTEEAQKAKTSWRKCLQLLVSGDYLTPPVVGLALRDWWMALPASIGLLFDDRSALLETAMERHYAAVTDKNCEEFEGLCAPFGHVDRSDRWLPGLILNSTLVERGQGVVVSDIDPASAFPDKDVCLERSGRVFPAHLAYPEAMPMVYDIFELMDARRNGDSAALKKRVRDIRISTAIVASARFPVISSRGNIRSEVPDNDDPTKKRSLLVGQIVDGGYYDNSGLASIFDIIDALSCNNVDSIVISIRNAPTDDYVGRLWRFPERENPRQPPLEISDEKIDPDFTPLEAFFNSSEGHVLDNRYTTIGRATSRNYLAANIYKAICMTSIKKDSDCESKALELQSLSMSWWLSAYAQGFIEIQDHDKVREFVCSQPNDKHCRPDLVAELRKVLSEPMTMQTTPSLDLATGERPRVLGLDMQMNPEILKKILAPRAD